MKDKITNGLLLALIACCCALPVTTNGWAQDEAAAEIEKMGRVALDARNYEQALKLFSEGSSKAADPVLKARLDFRQAVTLQQMASSPGVEDRQNMLRQAARLYHRYLKQNPKSAASANNLAKIYEQLGNVSLEAADSGQAQSYFKRANGYFGMAVAAGDSSQGLYLKNYAEFLERTGEWKKAKQVYAQLVQDYPLSPALQQSLAESFGRHGLRDLTEYLWNLLDAGYVQQSADLALQALHHSHNGTDKNRIELLTVVSACLAELTYDARRFVDSPMGLQIAALDEDDFLGDGAVEIIQLHEGQLFQANNYSWWAQPRFQRLDPVKGVWPADGFRALIRSLGSRAQRYGELEQAEAFYRLAANLLEQDADPVAIRAMCRMFAEANQLKKIYSLLDNYQISLFESKGQAYRESRDEKIFQYHQTLGEIYALIERWGDSRRADSAIFQLEHARQTSDRLEQAAGKPLPEKYQFTPQMVDILSRGYEKTGNTGKVVELRIDQAERYQKSGDSRASSRVLAPVKEAELPSSLQPRYEILKVSPEYVSPAKDIDRRRATIKKLDDSGK